MSASALSHKLLSTRPAPGLLLDVAVAAATFGGSLALIRHGGIGAIGPGSGQLDMVSTVLAACSTLPLVAWRRQPLGVFAVTSSVSVLLAGLGYRMDLLLGPAAALYLLAASREQVSPWSPRTTITVVGLFAAFLGAAAVARGTLPDSEFLHTGMAWAVAWFAGERTRLRQEQVADLRARALRTEREAERERRLVAAEERARIARDLHDSAGHAINVIVVRAGAARLRHAQDPDRSLAALEAIEVVARQTADEIDHIIGSLRDDSSANGVVALPAALASLDTLLARHREAGLAVNVDASGEARALDAPADQAAYRILQEALTNAARHGAGSARIELAFGDKSLELTVTNPVSAREAPPPSNGHGLVGMRERATLLGGSLVAERANGVFCVRARIPYGEHRS